MKIYFNAFIESGMASPEISTTLQHTFCMYHLRSSNSGKDLVKMVTISNQSYPYINSFDNTIKSISFLYTSIRKAMNAVVACKPHTAHVSFKTPKKLRLKRVIY